jgi:hypothetical protein
MAETSDNDYKMHNSTYSHVMSLIKIGTIVSVAVTALVVLIIAT